MQFSGKLALQQRVLPSYRIPFFDALAAQCTGGMTLFAGQARQDEAIKGKAHPEIASFTFADNYHFLEGPAYLCWQRGLIQWLEVENPDALVVEANPRYLSTPRAIEWMKKRGRPVLGWGLGAPPLGGGLSALRQRSRLRLLHSLDGILSYSQRGADEYRALGIPAERVFVAYNAAAPRPTQPSPPRPEHFTNNTPVILFVGRLQLRKRLDLLFKACASQSSQPELWIVGDGPDRERFEFQAKAIYPQTEFFGAKHGQELVDIFNQADLFVLPGTGGLAIQQAMSHGLPVVVAEGDGTQDDLVSPDNGWLIAPNNLPHLSGAIQTALANPEKLRKMGHASYRITAEEINLENMAATFIHALQSVSELKSN